MSLFAERRYVWLFRCSNLLALHAATLDRQGRNLPKDACRNATWSLIGQIIVGPENARSAGIDIEALKMGISKDGFFLWNADYEPVPD